MVSLSKSKKVKYSTINLAFIAIVIAIVAVINSIIYVVAEKYNWYIDMTDEQVFSLSDESKELISEIGESVKLEIVFPSDREEIVNSYERTSQRGAWSYVHETAEQIAQVSKNITISYHDAVKDYEFYKSTGIMTAERRTVIEDSVVILRKNDDGTYNSSDFRIYPLNYFFVGDENNNLYGYNGEVVFMNALVSISRDVTPTVYFTIKHGEKSFLKELSTDFSAVTFSNFFSVYYAGIINEDAASLMQTLCESGMEIKPIDLALEEIPDDARAIFINSPSMDFSSEETEKIDEYVKRKGTVFCFTSYDAKLPNLYSYLESEWGVKIIENSGTPVRDVNTSFGQDVNALRANIVDSTASRSYFNSLTNYSSARAKVKNTAAVTILPKFANEDDGFFDGSGARSTNKILETPSTAEYNGTKGTYTIMTISAREDRSDQKSEYSYFVFCPNDTLFSNQYMDSTDAPNRNILLSIVQNTTKVQTLLNINTKVFKTYTIDMSDKEARVSTVMLALILPSIITVCGIVVIVRRKRR